ncbi:terminase small subunit [Xanthocytophaga agilis]|uniref:Terminase small subunit n=1 Tax=Xanthocytophaga agilis TaxID=3048010 RepID=A0AAE3UGP8_9BACT|nr:terminase small subunit [Xanthocytophaga agilis]MDJ1501828.1 terminase small subunit [Xanthocytophaga agilis]
MTVKQLAFVNRYLVTGNATQSYMDVYGVESKEVANANAYRLLAKQSIQDYIKKHQKQMEKKTGITVEKVIAELAKIGFSNIQDYITDENTVEDLSKIRRRKAAAVSSVKTKKRIFRKGDEETETIETEFRLYDKISALEKIGKHLGAFFSIKELVDNLTEQQMLDLANELEKRMYQSYENPTNNNSTTNNSINENTINDNEQTAIK